MATAIMREATALSGYAAKATYAALFTTVPTGTTAGTEVTGGTPAYARKALAWTGGPVDGTVTASVTFDVPTGVTVAGAGLYDALTGGNYLDGGAPTGGSQAFAAQGTYTLTLTYTQN
jgi:hypothetical protein